MSEHNTTDIFQKASRIHIVGLGGIGVSALARWLIREGKMISGSDVHESNLTKALSKEGVVFFHGHSRDHIEKSNPDLIVASLAIPDENPEIQEARKRHIPVLNYPEALGALANPLRLLAVAGTNGKSTTTALAGLMLTASRIDPTILVGSIVKELSSNFQKGSSNIAVIEACEYKRAFLQYKPDAGLITNIESDHLDYYKSIEDIVDAFTHFALNIKKNGLLFVNADDRHSRAVRLAVSQKRPDIRIVSFGKSMNADIRFSGVRTKKEKTNFHIRTGGQEYAFDLQIPGEFNVYNAVAAFAIVTHFGANPTDVQKVFDSFHGIWRRFERVGEFRACPVISDYAHHPTAIEKTILAARSFFPKRRIFAVFEPHQHNRTRMLFDDFVKAFDEADVVVCSEIYTVAGRVNPEDAKISSADIVSSIKDRDGERGKSREILFAKNLQVAEALIRKHAKSNDCILVMGAGDIGSLPLKLVS